MKNKHFSSFYKLLTSFLLIVICHSVKGQEQFDKVEGTPEQNNMVDDQGKYLDFKTGWFMGAGIGTVLAYGDVTSYNVFPKANDFSKSFGSGISVLGGKKISWGLSGEIQIISGRAKGYKTSVANNPFYFNTEFQSYSISAKYNLSDLYLRSMGNRTNKTVNRLNTYISVGVGQAFYRSRLYYYADNRLKQTYGYKETSNTQSTGQQLLNKDKSLSSVIVPVGFKFQYRLNYKTDLVFDVDYTYTFTDKFDAWDRGWTKQDRYLYAGIGLILNFGRGAETDEIPKELRHKSKNKNDDTDLLDDTSSKKGLFHRKSNKSTTTEDADLNLRLKLFETQLKLFEMQHMIDEKK